MRGARDLDPTEIRILGCLLEKQLATPEYYPMTVNSLTAAANQKTNRDPVMSVTDAEVSAAVGRLHDELLVWKIMGSRVTHYDHNLEKRWELDHASRALLALLFLRGPQTAGELRGRSERLHQFESIDEVEQVLQKMAEPPTPLVRKLPRRPGQKEERWEHLAGGASAEPVYEVPLAEPTRSEPLSARVERLEKQLAELQHAFDALRAKLGE